MDRGLQLTSVQKILFVLAAAIVVLVGIRSVRFLLTPSLLALLIAVAVLPVQVALIINQLTDQVLRTHMMGRGLNLSPFTVVFSLVFWSFILGPLGAVLAIPLTLALKHLVLDVDPHLAWLSLLLSARVDGEAEHAAGSARPA